MYAYNTAFHENNVENQTTEESQEDKKHNCIDCLISFLATFVFILTFPITIFCAIKMCYEYERAVIFRLGRLTKKKKPEGPGIFIINPLIEKLIKVDLRTISFNIPPQEILSKDSVTVKVDAVVYFKVVDPISCVVKVENAIKSTQLLSQTTLRNMLGTQTLSEMLQDRETLSHKMEIILDKITNLWGIKVERIEIKDLCLPKDMQRSMAAEAESAREARANVIAAEGELQAAEVLRRAAIQISDAPGALQLRFLQTLNTISAEHNSTIIFPFPIDLLTPFLQNGQPLKS